MADMNQQRLEELGERIDRVRRSAEEHGLLPDSTPEPTFIEPNPEGPDHGDELEDYQIAPPG